MVIRMSEHMEITGKIDYIHLPYGDEGSFAYCHFCKKQLSTMTIGLHNGLLGDWIEVKCTNCKQVIWVASFGENKEEHDIGRFRRITHDKKCYTCKKKTDYYNSFCVSGSSGDKDDKYFCSLRCYNKNEKKK